MKTLELRIPPVGVFLICAASTWGINQWTFIEGLQFVVGQPIVWAIIGIGGLVGLLGVLEFRRSSTTVNPHKPEKTSAFVQSGVYQFSRNPMYLGLVIVLIGVAFKWGSLLGFLIIPIFIGYMNRFQIQPEEEMMEEKFGEEFTFYKEEVRRWA